ncbi:MAG: GNAT family N-acetyltransferase, partial [Bacteroidota bacterium]
DAAVALWRQLQADHETLDDRYRISADADARWATDFRTWTRSSAYRVWVAEAPEAGLVGLLTALVAEPAPVYEGGHFVFVSDLFVDGLWRGRGLATALLDEARIWAHEVGAREIRAGVLAANARGRGFWDRQGAVDFNVTVAIPLHLED